MGKTVGRRSRTKLVTTFAFCFLISLCSIVKADDRHAELRTTMEELLASPDIPSMQTVLDAYHGHPPTLEELQASYREVTENQWEAKRTFEFVNEKLPRYIAILEKAFPDGIWAPIGRDASYVTILLDPFYTSIGQPDRVKPVRGSGATIRINDEDLLIEFLKYSGMPTDLEGAPFVMFDGTSYRRDSQSVRLLRAGFKYFNSLGYSKQSIFTKFSFIAVGTGEEMQGMSFPDYFAKQTVLADARGQVYPPEPLTLSWHGSGGVSVWHGGYSAIEQTSDQKIVVKTGKLYLNRIGALIQLIGTYDLVNQDAFRIRVAREASNLGFTFNFKNKVNLPAIRFTNEVMAETKASLRDTLASLPEYIPQMGSYFSSNGKVLSNWIRDQLKVDIDLNNTKMLTFLENLSSFLRENKLARTDAERLVAQILTVINPDINFEVQLQALLLADPLLLDVFTKNPWVFYSPQTENFTKVSSVYDELRRNLLESLDCELNLTRPTQTLRKEAVSGA